LRGTSHIMQPICQHIEQLYQDNPFLKCTYTEHVLYSHTDCLESYDNWARKMMLILRWNHKYRQPRFEIVWHLLREFTKDEIRELRTKVFRSLRRWGITAVAIIEPTRGKDGRPNNTIHFHILTDDPRGEKELRELANKACRNAGLVRKGKGNDNDNDDGVDDPEDEFRIDVRELWDACKYYRYATKYNHQDKVILFKHGTKENPAIQKMYEIGNWFVDEDGVPISTDAIWDKIRAEMAEKEKREHLACIEYIRTAHTQDEQTHKKAEQEYIAVKGGVDDREFRKDYREAEHHEDRIKNDPDDPPAEKEQLQMFISQTDDNTLADYFCVAYGQPPIFDTTIPDWVYEVRCRKRRDLIRAIYMRISPTDFEELGKILGNECVETLHDWRNHLLGRPLDFGTKLPPWIYWLSGPSRKCQELLAAIDAKIGFPFDDRDILFDDEEQIRGGYTTHIDTKVEEEFIYHPAEYDAERDENYLEMIHHVSEGKSYTFNEYIALQAGMEGQRAHLPPITDLVPAEELQAIFGNLDRFSLLREYRHRIWGI